MPAPTQSSAGSASDGHVQEVVVDIDDLDQPIRFEAKKGKNKLVIRLRVPPYLFSL